MSKEMKILMTILVVIYVISPVDAMPGPIDDILVIALGILMKKRAARKAQIGEDR